MHTRLTDAEGLRQRCSPSCIYNTLPIAASKGTDLRCSQIKQNKLTNLTPRLQNK